MEITFMNLKRIFFTLTLLGSFAAGAFAQNLYYLPQVANGDFGSGKYKTTFVLFNNSDKTVYVGLDLTDDKGNPLVMTIPGTGTDSSFSLTLPAGSSSFLQTDGKGAVAAGAATVTATSPIGVSAIFSIYDPNGNYQTETGVGNSAPQTNFVLPVDTANFRNGIFNTGLALYNPGDDEANISLALRNTSGAIIATAGLKMAGGEHIAKFIAGANEFFPGSGAMQGTLLVQSSTPIAAMVLRQFSSSTAPSYTSLPVVPASSTQTTLNLAQVANGGGYLTSFLIFNISSSPANVSLSLTKSDGSPLNVTIAGQGTASKFTLNNLPAGGSVFLITDGSPSSPEVGAARITSNVPIGASGVFTVLESSRFKTETGVSDSPLLSSFTLPVDVTGTFNTGVAFFNPGSSKATLTFRRFDLGGAQVGSEKTRDLEGGHHLAIFVSEIFGATGFQGSLAVISTSQVAAMTLRMNNPPQLSYTTLPVVSGVKSVSGGGGTGTALLQKSETGVVATANKTVDEILPAGFKLSGSVSGPGTAGVVMARSGQTLTYAGAVSAGKYQVVLPAGTYDLSVIYTPSGVPSGSSLAVASTVATAVQVTSDTTRDLTIPALALYNISGTVSGLAALGNTNGLEMEFESGDGSIEASFPLSLTGSYSGVLPAGSYVAGVHASIVYSLQTGQTQSLGVYTLGAPVITGHATLPGYSIPALANLSGMIKETSIPVIGVTVSAAGANSAIWSNSSPDLLTARYRAALPRNTAYGVNVTMVLLLGATAGGSITFPMTPSTLTLSADQSGYDFTVPPLPGRVTVSGKVTDSKGNAVNGAVVSLYCESVTGSPNLKFAHSAITDSGGNYSVSVLSGTYTMVFTPPLP
jgi:hypothetical protein